MTTPTVPTVSYHLAENIGAEMARDDRIVLLG